MRDLCRLPLFWGVSSKGGNIGWRNHFADRIAATTVKTLLLPTSEKSSTMMQRSGSVYSIDSWSNTYNREKEDALKKHDTYMLSPEKTRTETVPGH